MDTDYAKFDAEFNRQLLAALSLPPALLQGTNYSSSRVALDMFEREHGIDKIPTSGGSWIGEVQST